MIRPDREHVAETSQRASIRFHMEIDLGKQQREVDVSGILLKRHLQISNAFTRLTGEKEIVGFFDPLAELSAVTATIRIHDAIHSGYETVNVLGLDDSRVDAFAPFFFQMPQIDARLLKSVRK